MVRKQKGFTLIELVMVIVILGILAAVAIPKYIDLRNDAITASFQGICGSVKSTAALLIASSTSTQARGTLKDRATIRANTAVDAGITLSNSGTAGAITMQYQGSSNDCTLGVGTLSSD